MLVELHMLQNFAPSNLNRDDTGAPKNCEFGGHRRARISSQRLKRAIRECFDEQKLLPADNLACRTKRIVDEIANRLAERGRDRELATEVIANALKSVQLQIDSDRKTQYLLYVAKAEIAALANVCHEHWDTLVLANGGTPVSSGKKSKRAAKETIPNEVRKEVIALLNGGKAADLALFGRMIADLPDKNVDAAAQVAHAISTNRVSVEFDYYTAVDDLKPEDTSGADMIGTVEFNSACFYRYANVDIVQLHENLLSDEKLSRAAVDAFIRAFVAAIPSGKQNSMAAQNPASLLMAVVRDSGPWSLANAFLQPVRPDATGDLVRKSLDQLDDYWRRLTRMYGTRGITGSWYVALDGDGVKHLGHACDNIDSLVETIMSKLSFATAEPKA